MKKYLIPLTVLALSAFGCGDDDDGGSEPIDNPAAETAATHATEDSQESLLDLSADHGDMSAIADLFGVYANLLSVGTAASTSPIVAALQTAIDLPRAEPDCADTVGNTTTYDDCDVGSYTLDGTLTVDGDDFNIDLDIISSITTVSFDADLVVTSTTIDGTFDVVQSVSSTDISVDADFIDVVFADGCAASGELKVKVTGQSTVSAIFGGGTAPDCIVDLEG